MKDLYYILMYNRLGNAKQCKTFIRHGIVKVNDQTVTDPCYQVDDHDRILFDGKKVNSQPFIYIMMNKPKDYICANHDKKEKCVTDLISQKECFCLGRLDKDTTGLLILTNDKSLKKLLLPENHIHKQYYVETRKTLNQENIRQFQEGIIIDKNIRCLPAKMDICDDHHCFVTIEEGKYHQIKKMFLSVGNQVVSLKRITFAAVCLDNTLKEGESRNLTELEKNSLRALCR